MLDADLMCVCRDSAVLVESRFQPCCLSELKGASSHFALLITRHLHACWSLCAESVFFRLTQAALTINSLLAGGYYVDVQRRKTQTCTSTR